MNIATTAIPPHAQIAQQLQQQKIAKFQEDLRAKAKVE